MAAGTAEAVETVVFSAPLSQGFGYGIIIGLGFAFALVMIFITWALKRYAPLEFMNITDCLDINMKSSPPRCSQRPGEVSSPAWWLRRL